MDLQAQQGLMPTYREAWRNRGLAAWVATAALMGFYCLLYWTNLFEPVAHALRLGDKWYLYGLLYCFVMIGGAVVYLRKHGSSRYNRVRIATNVAIQVLLGFTLPFVMPFFGGKDYYFSYFWPLKYDAILPWTLQSLPVYLAAYALIGAFVIAPIAALFTGKRWYCSWVCGCGALANTFGDPWRHLSDKSDRAWRIERWTVHGTLLVAIAMTLIVTAGELHNSDWPRFAAFADHTKSWYGFFVGLVLAGVVGTGVYPVLGPRVWCRYFCPMAAALGIIQKAGAFRIRVKKDMCISCGNCSAYCEMGIDVRSYAQANQSFTRASCVGCGMCAHVCPRGVLKLEAAWTRSPSADARGREIVEF